MKARLLLGVLLLGGFAGLVAVDAWTERPFFFSLLALVAIILSLAEYGQIVKRSVERFQLLPVAFYSAALIALKVPGTVPRTALPPPGPEFWCLFVLTVHLFAQRIVAGDVNRAFPQIGAQLLGFAWLSLGLSCFLDIVARRGLGHAIAALLVAKAHDIGALFAGKMLGRHKLCPRISPNKTVEGAAGGFLLSIAVAGVSASVLRSPALCGPRFLLFGTLVSAAAMLGDLAESLLKRGASVKDSASWIPGFGGVLDMMDSLTLSGPVALAVLWCLPA